jgi:AcrR family transcriptional regulator
MKMKKRGYTLKKRAESQAETRQRIVEAAVELHGEVGPSRTTVSMVAERAGVQRHTFYAHFEDDRALLMACSAHHLEQSPMPDAEAWKKIENPEERLRVAFAELYSWFSENEQVLASVLRDAEFMPLVKEVSGKRFGPYFAAYHEVLGEKLPAKQRAMLALSLSFYSWRTLARDGGLSAKAAAQQMAHAVAATK